MAKTTVDSSTSTHAESSTAAMLSRNDDPMTRALRSEGALDINQIIHLNRQASPVPCDSSTSGTLTSTLPSSHKPSTVTKPTSAGTSYPVEGSFGKGKGQAVATYASSLSATHGSGSDTELDAGQLHALAGVGEWAGESTLKGAARAKKRSSQCRRPKHKKPVVVIQQDRKGNVSDEDDVPAAKSVARRNGKEAKYLRQRRSKTAHDQWTLAEEGRLSDAATHSSPQHVPLSRARFYVLIGLVVAIALTFSLSAFAAHYTGRGRMNCTKGIIFSGTVLVSCLTVLAMIVARRAVQEALLAGLFEFLIGSLLVIEIHDFM